MILVRNLISTVSAQTGKRPVNDWLTESERLELTTWRNKMRVDQWLAGRWLAKRQIESLIGATTHEINIASRDSFGRSVAPRVYLGGRAWTGSLSISHAGDHVVIAIDSRPSHRVGVDVVLNQDAWNNDAMPSWFSNEEQKWIRATENPTRQATRLWAAKEASYKAMQRGEPFIPRDWPALKWLQPPASSQLEFVELSDAVIAVISATANRERPIA